MKNKWYLMMSFLLVFCPTFALANQDNDVKRVNMLEKLKILNEKDFSDTFKLVDECIEKYNAPCAKKYLEKAALHAFSNKDKRKIKAIENCLDGIAYLIDARHCIDKEMYHCADENLNMAARYSGSAIYSSLVKRNRDKYHIVKKRYDHEQEKKKNFIPELRSDVIYVM